MRVQPRKHSVAGPGGTSSASAATRHSEKRGHGSSTHLLLEESKVPTTSSAANHVRGAREETKIGKQQQGKRRRYQIFGLANPRSGDGLASGFLTDYPPVNEKTVYLEQYKQSVHVEMRLYNVLEATERQNCLRQLESAVQQNDKSTKKVVCIMGGDGSLATTIKFLRGSLIIESCLQKGKVSFVMLPFGTGNDGSQVFGWGSSPFSELWL